MPTFGYASDIHLSFYPREKLPLIGWSPDVDVILLAGDIMDGVRPYAIDHVLKMTEGVQTIMTLGNHEIYGTDRGKALQELRTGFSGTHVEVLLNESILVDGVRIAATDLWTDFGLLGDRQIAMDNAKKSMSDYRKILVPEAGEDDLTWRNMKPSDAVQWHNAARKFILNTLNESYEPVVLLTHHAPSVESVPLEHRGHRLSPCYASELSEFYASAKQVPVVNVHGHIHRTQDYRMGCGTQVLANPMGYYGHNEATGFDAKRQFSVSRDGLFYRGL